MENQVRYTVSAQDLLTGKLNNMNASAKGLEGTLAGLGGVVAGAFSIYAIQNFITSITQAGTTVENATVGLTTLLGNANDAAQVIKNTMQDATKTPFEFKSLLSANKALISSGIEADKARKDVLNLANAISATGGGNDELTRMVVNMQQISNSGRATAQDIKQFAYAGINIYKVLSDATGRPIEEIREMGVSYDMLTMALDKAHKKGGVYYNGLENMANTTSVKLSNVGDALFQFYNDIFVQIKPFVDGVLNSVLESIKGVSNAFINIKTFLEPLFKPIQNLGIQIYNSFKAIIDVISQFSGEGLSLLTILRGTLSFLIDTLSYFYNVLSKFLVGVIDVIHTVYVLLDKLGVIWVIGKAFELVWSLIKGISNSLVWVYNNTLKPIFDGVTWMYDVLKAMLKIKDIKINPIPKIKTDDEDEKEKTDESKPKGNLLNLQTASNINKSGSGGKSSASNVSGSKSVTVNVTIGNLVNDFIIQTTNIKEGADKLHDMIVQTLTGAINDSKIVAES